MALNIFKIIKVIKASHCVDYLDNFENVERHTVAVSNVYQYYDFIMYRFILSTTMGQL